MNDPTRRRFLAGAGTAATAGLAGCGGLVSTTNSRAPPVLDQRPAGVYLPTHVEGMLMAGRTTVGGLEVALTYTLPHRFWTVTKSDGRFTTNRTEIEQDDAVHLMATVWEPETGVVVPNTGLSLEISRDGDLVSEEVIYPMLAQRMGFHYGANFPLDGDGTYDVRVSVGGVSTPRYGAFEGRFEEPAAATIPLEYSREEVTGVDYRNLDRQGEPDAVEPMAMDGMPVGRVPDPFPGDALGSGSLGDLQVTATRVDADRFGSDPYLAVAAVTPYNQLAVPGAAMEAGVEGAGAGSDGGSGSGSSDGGAGDGLITLSPAIDPELGVHYGASVPGLAPDAAVELRVTVPPQVARHEGYETAFLQSGAVDLA